MSRPTVIILGGTGFVGRAIATRLTGRGHDVHIISRRRERHRALLVLPRLRLYEGDCHDLGVLRTRFQEVDAVINLVGILNERRGTEGSFNYVHRELANKVVAACQQTGVTRLLHMSALNASPQGPSRYLRSKGDAEDRVHEAGDLRVTSFRPSVIFGAGDSFLNRFAILLKKIPFAFPLACPEARFQPVFVEDIAQSFVNALERHDSFGQRYDLCGPRVYALHELVRYVDRCIGTHRRILGLSDALSKLQAAFLQYAPGKPFTPDNLRSMRVDSVCETNAWRRLGITPRILEDIAPAYLRTGGERRGPSRGGAGR